jgi:hypothetical protein
MNKQLIVETKELEEFIKGKVVEGEGSRVDERANIHFGYSGSLDRDVIEGRLTSEAAARFRYISALCTARKATELVRSYNLCRAQLEKLFAEFRQRRLNHHVDNN